MRAPLLTPLLALALALAGCAATPEPPPGAAAATDAQAGFADSTPLTGSRFVRRTTDRHVRVIGNDGARTEMSDVKGIANSVGSRGN